MTIWTALALGIGIADFLGLLLTAAVVTWLFRQHYKEHDR